MKGIFRPLVAAIAFVCLGAAPVTAQTTVVSAAHAGGTAPFANATIYWQAIVPARVGTNLGQITRAPQQATVTAGVFSLTVADALDSSPSTCYAVTVVDNVTGLTLLGAGLTAAGNVQQGGAYGCLQPTGATWNFDDYVPGTAGVVGSPLLNWAGTWASGTSYAVGAAVSYEGSSYANTLAGNTNAPPGTGWVLLAQSGSDALWNWRGNWAADTSYARNDAYIEAGNAYVVITAYTSGATFGSTDTANAQEIATVTATALADLGVTPLGIINVKAPPYNATGNGSTDDYAAVAAAATAAAAGPYALFFPAGTYLMGSSSNQVTLTIPQGVSMYGSGAGVSKLVWGSTTQASAFVVMVGSHHRIRDLSINGERANNPNATATVLFANPNCTTGVPSGQSGSSIAGGLLLSAGISAGATSFTVSTASCGGVTVQPLDYITLFQSPTNYETVQVAKTYTVGSATIPLTGPTKYAYTTSAAVTLAITDVDVDSNTILGTAFDGLSLWHVVGGSVTDNYVVDAAQSPLDLPDGGSQDISILGNTIQSNGLYGITVDSGTVSSTVPDQFGHTSKITIAGNKIKLLSGTSTPWYGIQLLHVDHATVANNTVDISAGGIADIGLFDNGVDWSIVGNAMVGNSADQGCIDYGSLGTLNNPNLLTIEGNTCDSTYNGINLYNAENATLIGNVVSNYTNYAYNAIVNGTYAQTFALSDNIADGSGVVAYRFAPGGTQSSTSTVSFWQNLIIGTPSYAGYETDTGWTVGVSDAGGNLAVPSGTNIVYRCVTAGTKDDVGTLTITAASCGSSVDTGLRVK